MDGCIENKKMHANPKLTRPVGKGYICYLKGVYILAVLIRKDCKENKVLE